MPLAEAQADPLPTGNTSIEPPPFGDLGRKAAIAKAMATLEGASGPAGETPPPAGATAGVTGPAPAAKPETAGATGATGPENPSLAKGWQAIKAQENRIRQQAQQLEEKYRGLAQREQQIAEFEKKFSSLKADPLAFLKEHGFTEADLAHRLLNENKAAPTETERRMVERLEALQKELAEMKQGNTRQSEIGQIQKYADGVVQTLSDPKYSEFLAWCENSIRNPVELAMTANNEHFRITKEQTGVGKSLTPRQVLDSLIVEAQPYIAKMRAAQSQEKAVVQPEQPAQARPAQQPAPTLSSKDGGASMADRPDLMSLDFEQRKNRMKEALMFEDAGTKK